MSNTDRRALAVIACLALFILPMTIYAATMGRSYDQHVANQPAPVRTIDVLPVVPGGITPAPICGAEDEIGCVFIDRHDDSDPARGIVDHRATWWTCIQSADNGLYRYTFHDTAGNRWEASTSDETLVVPNPITCATSGV
jgi:hypothetical protein